MKLTKDDKAMLKSEFEKVWGKDSKMVDWCVKNTSGYIEIDGIIITYDKPHIQTEFWFGEHTYDYDEVSDLCDACSEDETYFIERNMRGFDQRIEFIEDTSLYGSTHHVYISPEEYSCQDGDCKLGCIEFCRWDPPRTKDARELTRDELAAYLEFLKEERAKFEKRLHTYLKRYGLSKCHYGVYWADR